MAQQPLLYAVVSDFSPLFLHCHSQSQNCQLIIRFRNFFFSSLFLILLEGRRKWKHFGQDRLVTPWQDTELNLEDFTQVFSWVVNLLMGIGAVLKKYY